MITAQDIFDYICWTGEVPERLAALTLIIIEWDSKEGNEKTRNISESFAGYSVSRATANMGQPQGWQNVFAQELNVFRKPKVL